MVNLAGMMLLVTEEGSYHVMLTGFKLPYDLNSDLSYKSP